MRFFFMELLHGMDLDALVEKHGPLPPERAVYLLRQACRSLEEAHSHGLVHRDIKAANLLACRVAKQVDYLKVLDFGLVKRRAMSPAETKSAGLTAEGMIVGTPATMAPEQVLGKEVDARTDIYALGCVAYFLLTGRDVYDATSAVEMCMQHINGTPESLKTAAKQDVPAELEELVMSCLAREPEDRPKSATELGFLLDGVNLDGKWGQRKARAWWREHMRDVATVA
jgi:serine/threonine-protein kinase